MPLLLRSLLAAAGHLTEAKYRGSKVARPFNQGTIEAMIEGPAPHNQRPPGGSEIVDNHQGS